MIMSHSRAWRRQRTRDILRRLPARFWLIPGKGVKL